MSYFKFAGFTFVLSLMFLPFTMNQAETAQSMRSQSTRDNNIEITQRYGERGSSWRRGYNFNRGYYGPRYYRPYNRGWQGYYHYGYPYQNYRYYRPNYYYYPNDGTYYYYYNR